MMKQTSLSGFITLWLLSFSFMVQAQVYNYSLESSSDGISWQVFPKASTPMTGQQLSSQQVSLPEHVRGVVPGTVFTAYVEAGHEACPEYADNIYKVDESRYNRPFWYVGTFSLPQSPSADQQVWLCFDNINKYADFYFNGHKISGSNTSEKDVKGHMLRSRFNVTHLYRANEKNIIAVLIYDPDQRKSRNAKDPYGVACSPSYLAGAGWDWMPYVPGRLAGITGHARVEVTGSAVLVDPWVRSHLPTLQQAELSIASGVANHSSQTQSISVQGTIMPGNIQFSKTLQVAAGDTAHFYLNKYQLASLVINNPKLWWPNGYGAPNLYTCRLQCSVDGKVSDVRNVRFGIRKYEYRMVDNAVGFPVLNLYVNDKHIFVKGGNWGMSEYMLRCHGKQYETKIRLHKDMNYNMIRLWTGCVTDDEFYDYCDEQGIMVWDDFWLYVAYNDVADHNAFIINARDKVRRLRNHACIAVWCGANETHPVPDIDQALRMIVMKEDGNDRLYKSCSNQDGLSGSGWWRDFPPAHHFETSASNLAFEKPAYPYGYNYGYGFRTEIGMATFPQYESVCLFIPKDKQWPLPSEQQLKEDNNNLWNYHFFGKEASNAFPISYVEAVDKRYGKPKNLESFCERAQLVNLEDMKGMYEAWQDKMWNDAAGMLIWMSHPAYPSFVWQTYDYYYDPTGCYWGARKACEPQHVQWNCLTGSVKVINASASNLDNVTVTAIRYNVMGQEIARQSASLSCPTEDMREAFVLNTKDAGLQFIRLLLVTKKGKLVADNFYWTNGREPLCYEALASLPTSKLEVSNIERKGNKLSFTLTNKGKGVAFANRLRLVNKQSGERVLPVLWSDNYLTLMPGEQCPVAVEMLDCSNGAVQLLCKTYAQRERCLAIVR